MMEHISAHFQLRSSISKGFRFKFQTGTKSYSLKFHSTWTFIFLSLPSYKVASHNFLDLTNYTTTAHWDQSDEHDWLTYHIIPTTPLTAGWVRIWKAHWGQSTAEPSTN